MTDNTLTTGQNGVRSQLLSQLSNPLYSDRFTARIEIQKAQYVMLDVQGLDQPQHYLTKLTMKLVAVNDQGEYVDSCIFDAALTNPEGATIAVDQFKSHDQLTIVDILNWPLVQASIFAHLGNWQAAVYQRLEQEAAARAEEPVVAMNLTTAQ